MTYLTKQNPWGLNAFNEFNKLANMFNEKTYDEMLPPVSVIEQPDKLMVEVDLPGIEKENIDVKLDAGVLTVSAERRKRIEQEGSYYRCEQFYGKFIRSFTLPSKIDTDKVNANYENGVLMIELPKATEEKTAKIQIK